MSEPPTVELTDAERLASPRLRAGITRLRDAAAENAVVKLTPDAALAIADLIELLARKAGVDLSEPVQP